MLDSSARLLRLLSLLDTARERSGAEDAAARALAKLERILPSRLRHRVGTLDGAVVRVPDGGPRVAPGVLVAIAEACRRQEVLRFGYTGHDGRGSLRRVEPHRLVSAGRHWYLVAFDTDRDDWRTFRVDRADLRVPTGPRFTPRPLPGGDAAAFVADGLSRRAWPVRATVLLHASAGVLAERLWPGTGVLEAVDGERCLLHVGAPDPADLVWVLTSTGVGFDVVSGPPELTAALRAQARRCLRAVRTGTRAGT
ncbi:hypothetical protein NUM3379_15170 [Kineococcus sp. NUM-3379]